jgi:hypothetical protein
MSDLTTYPLRLPRSIRAGLERLSKQDGTSISQCGPVGRIPSFHPNAGSLHQAGRCSGFLRKELLEGL